MKSWKKKIAVMRFFGALPGGSYLLDIYRYYLGGMRNHNLEVRWKSIAEVLIMLKKAGIAVEGKDVAEVGSGWHPIFAPLLHGLGAATIRMTDIAPHARNEFINASVQYLISKGKEISELSGVPAERLVSRWQKLVADRQPMKSFKENGISYHAPFEISKAAWKAESLDLVFSNSCLGFVPRPVLVEIFSASYRLLRKGGHVAHNVDGVDCLTGGLDFLEFSQEEWEKVGCCKLHYQNRLRPKDYVKILGLTGFELVYEERTLPPDSSILKRQLLHRDFQTLPDSELLCFHFLFAGRKN